MIFIDGETRPSLHGTGTVDWCSTAWCPQEVYSAPYHGIILYSGTPNSAEPWKGKNTLYRYHIEDPIRCRKSIRVYLTKPQRGGPPLPVVEFRLPSPEPSA